MRAFIITTLLGFALAEQAGHPDACAKKCIETHDACRGAPGANLSTCSSNFANCLGYKPDNDKPLWCKKHTTPSNSTTTSTSPSHTKAPHVDECAKKCTDTYNACRTKPGANMSTCASDYASCLGFSPFQGNGTVTPTACKASNSTAAPTVPVTAGGEQLTPLYTILYALGLLAFL
jgi:hypothetical protein